jgi:hypothetical protein
MRTRRILLALVVVILAAPAAAQPGRVDPNARAILDYRLTLDTVRRVENVMLAMDRMPPLGPEAAREDVMVVSVLGMAWAYNQRWRDQDAEDMIRTLDDSHA